MTGWHSETENMKLSFPTIEKPLDRFDQLYLFGCGLKLIRVHHPIRQGALTLSDG